MFVNITKIQTMWNLGIFHYSIFYKKYLLDTCKYVIQNKRLLHNVDIKK